MTPASLSTLPRQARTAVASSAEKLERVQVAVARARRLQGERISDHVIDVHPAMAALLPDGGLKPGATYGVDGSAALISALVAGPSADGLWCGIVGLPGFSAEAAAALGCDLGRLVFVPQAGHDWVNVVAAMIDALPVVVVRPTGQVSDAAAARLSARLRQRESVLIACGPWPRVETRLSVRRSSWVGLGAGHGHLTSRRVSITVSGRGTHGQADRRTTSGEDCEVWLPDAAGTIRLVDATALRTRDRGLVEDSAVLQAATG